MDSIKNPLELLDFMSSNIKYGYLSKNGRLYYYDDEDFNSNWYNEYVLESSRDVFNNLCGNCFDQVEFERDWFLRNGYTIKTIFMMVLLPYKNNYPSHSFLIYKEGSKWCLFENADYNNRGIFKFNTIIELIKYQYDKYLEYLKTFNISDEEIDNIIIREFQKPKSGIGAKEYLDFVINSSKITVGEDK